MGNTSEEGQGSQRALVSVMMMMMMMIDRENIVFWHSCKNRLFGGTKNLHYQGDKNLFAMKKIRRE
jgi:hypothetical protein